MKSPKKMKNNNRFPKIRSPLFIDTGPLLLLLIGNYNINLVGKVKRIKNYRPIHFDILNQFVTRRKLLVTPGVITELSNLTKNSNLINFDEFIRKNLTGLNEMGECHITKEKLINTNEFTRFGYTDTSIILCAKEKNVEVLTEDYPLFQKCKKLGMRAQHMDSLKETASLFE